VKDGIESRNFAPKRGAMKATRRTRHPSYVREETMPNASGSSIRSLGSALVGLGLFAAAPAAHAEQFVLLDVTFTFTKSDADNATPSKSHYYVKSDRLSPDMPVDWTQPIDYRNGKVHVRTEVMDKPAGSAETRWTLCYIARKGIDAGYGCSNTAAYKEEGVWDFEQGMTEWWQNDNIDWTQGIKQMDLVMKDNEGVFAHTMPDPEHWFPTTLRITMIQVSEGSTYDPSLVPGIPSGAGGSGGGGGMGSAGSAGAGGSMAVAGSGSEPVSGGAGAGGASAAGTVGTPSLPVAGMANGGSSAGGVPASAGVSAMAPSSATEDDAGCAIGRARGSRPSWALAGFLLAFAAAWRRRKL
jgi:MYXO-CTERM domain-containing protein